jgi:hypothetical protein
VAKDKTLNGEPTSPTKRNPLVQAYLDDLLVRQGAAKRTVETSVSESRPPGPPKQTSNRPSSETAGSEATASPQTSSPVERVSAVADWGATTSVDDKVQALSNHQAKVQTKEDTPKTLNKPLANAGALAIKPEPTGFPDWAAYDFDCLIFEVFDIRLSAPMECLGGIHNLVDYEKAPLFGQPDWYLGVVSIHGQQMKLLDTSVLLMPERNQRMTLENVKYAVQLNKSGWCLACHSLSDSVMIDKQAVRWRNKRQQRPWFIGTLIEYMCSVIDVDRLEQHLDEITKKDK